MNMTTVNTKADVAAVVDMCHEEGYRTRVIKLCDCWLIMYFN